MSFATKSVRLGKARGEYNESGVPQKADVVGTLSHFRVGPQANLCAAAASFLSHVVARVSVGSPRSRGVQRGHGDYVQPPKVKPDDAEACDFDRHRGDWDQRPGA